MPCRFGTSGSVRASSTPKSARCAHVVHTFWPVTSHVVAVALGTRRERREVGTRARLAEQLAPHLLVAHDRRQEAQPLLLGAVREQRRRGEVEAERVQPAEVVRTQLRLDRGARSPARGRARRRRPARSARRAPTPRTPGTTPRTRHACAPRGSRPHHRSGPRRSTHAARARRPTRARRRRRPSAPCRYRPRARRSSSSPVEVAAGAARGTRRAPRGSPRCATTARARTPRWRGAARATASAPCVQQPLREAEGDRRTVRERARRARRPRRRARPRAPRGGSRPTPAASVPESFRPSSNSSRARTSPTRRGSNQVAPLSGVKPRSVNGSQNVASAAAIVKSAASASWKPMPGGPAAHLAHDRHLHARASSGISRCAWSGSRRWMLPARGRRLGSALRATMSAPPQKWSPAPSSTITRTPSSVPAALERVDQAHHHRFVDRVALVGPVEGEVEHVVVECDDETVGAGTGEVGHRRENSAEIASSALCRSRAPPGGSGRRTAPCSRLGSRIVAVPGVVTSPRWFAAASVEIDRGPVAVGQVLAHHACRAATACRRRS